MENSLKKNIDQIRKKEKRISTAIVITALLIIAALVMLVSTILSTIK
jgi:cell division protein FtsL